MEADCTGSTAADVPAVAPAARVNYNWSIFIVREDVQMLLVGINVRLGSVGYAKYRSRRHRSPDERSEIRRGPFVSWL